MYNRFLILQSHSFCVTSCSCCFWGILEMHQQEHRVIKGWFPENPKRHGYYDSKDCVKHTAKLVNYSAPTKCPASRSLRLRSHSTAQLSACAASPARILIKNAYISSLNRALSMNKKQKMQVALIIIAAILIVIWFVLPGSIETRILGVISNALLILSMVLSYRAEEKNKKKTE